MSRLLDCDYGSRWRRMARDPASIAAWWASVSAPAAATATTTAAMGTGAAAAAAPIALVPATIGGPSLAAAHATYALGAGAGTAIPLGAGAGIGATLLNFFKDYGNIVGAGTGLVGAGTAAAGSAAQTRAMVKGLEAQSAYAEADAAALAAEREAEAKKLEREGKRLAAAQRAALSASGVAPGKGTALLLQQNLEDEAEREVASLRASGVADVSKLYGLSRLRGMEARGARVGGALGSVSSLLEGGAKFGLRLTNPTTGLIG